MEFGGGAPNPGPIILGGTFCPIIEFGGAPEPPPIIGGPGVIMFGDTPAPIMGAAEELGTLLGGLGNCPPICGGFPAMGCGAGPL